MSSSANLVEVCVGLAVLDGTHLVCGTQRNYHQVFYTFDLDSGELTDLNEESFTPLQHMRTVPGRRRFSSIPMRRSPGKLELWDFDSGAVVFSGTSPHHGDFLMNYAFLGEPATHLVAPGGELVRILPDMGGCTGSSNITPGENCLTRDGTLGLLPAGAKRYLDVQTGADGFVYGLYSKDEDGFRPGCDDEGACFLQRIDVDGRSVIDERPALLDDREHFYLYPHPDGRGVAIMSHEEDRWRSIEPHAPSGGWSAYYAGL